MYGGKFIWAQFFAYLGLGKHIYGNRPQGPHILKGFDNMRKAASLNRLLQHMMVIILPVDWFFSWYENISDNKAMLLQKSSLQQSIIVVCMYNYKKSSSDFLFNYISNTKITIATYLILSIIFVQFSYIHSIDNYF